jgi:hypothetical protein
MKVIGKKPAKYYKYIKLIQPILIADDVNNIFSLNV